MASTVINNQRLDTPAERIFAFFRLAKERLFSARSPSCSFLDIAMLKAAAEHNNPSMKDIADMLHIAGPTATPIVDRLVEKGELVRAEDPNDRRIVRLSLTETGKKVLKAGMKESIIAMNQLLSVLNEKECADLDRIITKIILNK
ncbi:MAG: MarR family transcriptional regulator [Candidatus Pacebacteria bacterium]|nr:MarR family transcriptional regulator [Candidatus Paceibacterota bacterium]